MTAGQSFILGYTDEKQGIYQASQENPCIIFDDFTTSFHWVDFPFKIKSSAMKILNLNQLHEVQTAKSVVGVEGECERGEGATSQFKPLSPLTKKDIHFKFVYYAMKCIKYESTEHQRQWINKYSHFKIPLPPLKVQEAIVRILDTFTELERELEMRQKQYAYYRNYLLDFELGHYKNIPVEYKKLGEIFNIRGGYTPSKANTEFWENGEVSWFRMDDIRTNGRILNESLQKITKKAVRGSPFPANSLIFATTATIGEHALITADFVANQQFSILTKIENCEFPLNMKFVFYYGFILGQWCKENVNVSGFASVDMNKFKNFKIPLPPLKVQEEIVEILDKFDALVNDLKSGIPAEIKARSKQYEYYRQKLLSFREA